MEKMKTSKWKLETLRIGMSGHGGVHLKSQRSTMEARGPRVQGLSLLYDKTDSKMENWAGEMAMGRMISLEGLDNGVGLEGAESMGWWQPS